MRNLNTYLFDCDSTELPDNFVGAAVYINEDGYPYHAGFAIGYRGTHHLFHFRDTDEKLIFENLRDQKWYVHKEFVNILPELAAPFLNHCKKISSLSAPKWGLYFNGAYFKNGKLFNEEGSPYYMSCVGFCLAVLLGFDETENYIQYTDWTADNSLRDDYFRQTLEELLAANPDIKKEDIMNDIRRIKPVEFLASAYISETPIRKASVDRYSDELKAILRDKRTIKS